MIQSMTGFATTTIILHTKKGDRVTVSLHLKSLNARHLEVNCKLPHPLSHLETDLIKLFKLHLCRGYISLVMYLDNPAFFKGDVLPAMSTLEGYMHALKRIKKEFSLEEPITLDQLVALPHIFIIEEKSINPADLTAVMHAVEQLIKKVISERKKEGKVLKKDIEERLSIIDDEIATIAQRSALLIAEQKNKINQLNQEAAADNTDFNDVRKNALYSMLDKIDIHEEIVRFQNHLESMYSHLKSNVIEKGKRLDFTLQELAREINTIAAKCSDSEISMHAINVKVEIEKVREQVQNIV